MKNNKPSTKEAKTMKRTMQFSQDQLDSMIVAIELRREASLENDEVVDVRKWEAILAKLNLLKNYGGEIGVRS